MYKLFGVYGFITVSLFSVHFISIDSYDEQVTSKDVSEYFRVEYYND